MQEGTDVKPTLVFRFLMIALVASFLSAAAESPCLTAKEATVAPSLEPCGGSELLGSSRDGTCDAGGNCCGGEPEAPCVKVKEKV